MKPIKIVADREYEIHFVQDWRKAVNDVISRHDKVILIAPQDLVGNYNLQSIESNTVKVIEVPNGEAAKSTDFLLKMWDVCASFGLTRSDAIVGLGGGATTDLAGFVAATWLRGISWYAVPTSLAGMVDAAIGGKTGINSVSGKNLIGSFYSPSLVIIDETFLQSLSERDFNAGMAEVIKAGFIANPRILELAEDAKRNIGELIWLSVEVKAKVVSSDFKESKLREILNYGHTLGHAIEKIENYSLRHGEAVSIGLVFAAELSEICGELSGEIVTLHRSLLNKFNLPTTYKSDSLVELIEIMGSDKKTRGAKLRFIGLSEVGKPVWLEDVTEGQIRSAYERISS